MTDDIREQLQAISGGEPTLHTVDKKLDIVIFELARFQKDQENMKKEQENIKTLTYENKNKIEKVYTVAGVISVVITTIGGAIGWVLGK